MNYFIRFLLVSQFLFIYMAGIVYSQDTPASYLKQIKEWVRPPASGKTPVSYIDSTWNNWLERTGELPPDFDSMASVPFLPDPLVISDGDSILPIQNMEQWNIKKQQIKKE